MKLWATATIHLRGVRVGETVYVDTESDYIRGALRSGFLVPLGPTQPPSETTTEQTGSPPDSPPDTTGPEPGPVVPEEAALSTHPESPSPDSTPLVAPS